MAPHRKKTQPVGLRRWVVCGLVTLMTVAFGLNPPWAHSNIPPFVSEHLTTEYIESVTTDSHQSWSAFRSDETKSICVTVVNFGASEVFVHLFQKRALAGVFTVLPQQASAMCSDVTVIEVECGTGSCLPQWYISEFF